MIQETIVNISQVGNSEIRLSGIKISQISPEQEAQMLAKQNRHLLKTLCQKQMSYISSLKIINFGIKFSLQTYFGSEEKERADEMFGHIIEFIKIHTDFYYALKKMVEQFHQINEQITYLLDLHFKKLACYQQYIEKTSIIIKDLDKIVAQNKKKVRQIFRDFQQPLQDYILAPIHQIAYYNTFTKQYIKNLKKQNPILKNLKKSQKLLQDILLFKLNMVTDNPSAQILQFLQNLFKGFVNLQVLLQTPISYKGLSCILYIVREDDGKVGIAALTKQNQMPSTQFVMIVTDSTHINLFTNTINVKNRIGICCVDQFHMVRLEQYKNVSLLAEKFKLLQSAARFRHIRPDNLYQYITNSFHISFNLLGVQKIPKSTQVCYVIKLENYQFKLSQHIFITMKKLQEIVTRIKKSLKIQQIEGIKSQNFLDRIKSKNDDIQQAKWISLQETLNILVRDIRIRTHSQYFFNNLRVFQGLWHIMSLQSYNVKHSPCNYCQKINLDEQDIINLIYYVEEYDQGNNKICLYFLLKARQQLMSKLAIKSNFFNQRFSKNGFSSIEKSQLINLKANKIGWKLQRPLKKFPLQKKIKVVYRNIEGHLNEVQIQQNYKQQTVEVIIKKICQKLGIKFHRDFNLCNYNSMRQQEIVYDDHQYISDILQTKPDLYLTKIYYFSDLVQEQLILQQNIKKNIKLHINIGEIIHKIRNCNKEIDIQKLKQLLKHLIQILKDQKLIKTNQQITEVLLKFYLNKKHHHIITKQFVINLRELLQIKDEQNRKTWQIYQDIIKNYNLIEGFLVSQTVLYIKTQIISSRIYENYLAIIRVDYQKVYIQVEQLGKWINLKHNQYSMQIIGNLISFKQIDSKDVKWIRTQNSYPLWRKIKTYQKMYKEIKNRNYQNPFISGILSNGYIFT